MNLRPPPFSLLLLVALSLILRVEAKRYTITEDYSTASCGVYDKCLQTYDSFVKSCGSPEDDKEDETDSCYGPIAAQRRNYASNKEERNRLLRRCFSDGILDEDQISEDEVKVAKRVRGTCTQKLYEMEEFLRRHTEKAEERLKRKVSSSYSSCKAAAKRVKERCTRIEPCCPRIKLCRRLLSKHEITEHLRQIEADMKANRRKCRETST